MRRSYTESNSRSVTPAQPEMRDPFKPLRLMQYELIRCTSYQRDFFGS